MLPAQPPKSRLRAGTRNDTLSICSWSGRICSAKRPSKLMMVSKAREPQITAAIGMPVGSWIESEQAVTCNLAAQRGVGDGQGQRAGPLGRGRDDAAARCQFAGNQDAGNHRRFL